MQLFYFNGIGGILNPSNASIITRAGFMVADTVVATPQTTYMINITKSFSRFSLASKLEAVLTYLDKREPEQATQLRDYAQLIKKIRAAKRKDQQEIVLIRKFENLVEEYHRAQVAEMHDGLEKFGLPQLQELIKHEAFLHYEFSNSNPENPEKDETALSQLLQMFGDSNDRRDGIEDVFFALPLEFLISAATPAFAGSIAEALPGDGGDIDADGAAVWVEPLLLLPNINTLSVTELQTVRHQMREPGKALRLAADEWMADSLHDRRSIRGRARFFMDTILPAATGLQAMVNGNKVLNAHRIAQANDRLIQLYAAEMPLNVMWSFYEKEGCLVEETLEKLRPVWNTRGSRRYPMFIIGPPGGAAAVRADAASYIRHWEEEEKAEDELTADEALPVSVRKSIDLS